MTSYSRKRQVHRPNVATRQEKAEKDWHVRQCLLESLTPDDWDAMDQFEPDRDYWQTISMIELKSSILRLNEARQATRAESP